MLRTILRQGNPLNRYYEFVIVRIRTLPEAILVYSSVYVYGIPLNSTVDSSSIFLKINQFVCFAAQQKPENVF